MQNTALTERKSSKTPVKVMMIFVVLTDVVPQFVSAKIYQPTWNQRYQ